MNKYLGLTDKGFSLVETVVVMGVGSIIALAFAQMMAMQAQSMNYFNAQAERLEVVRLIEDVLDNPTACLASLGAPSIPTSTTTPVNIVRFEDQWGNELVRSNTSYGTSSLDVGQIHLMNIDVPGPGDSGMVEVVVPLTRKTKGGGPREMPYVTRINVTTNATGAIASCNSAIAPPELELIAANDATHVGKSGHLACNDIGKRCGYVMSHNSITHDARCPSASHCNRVCNLWYNQSLPGVTNGWDLPNVHSCDARVGQYTTYLHGNVVRCHGWFSAVCY